MSPYPVLFEETVPGGWNWSHVVKRGTALELTDLEGGGCVALLAYNPLDTTERYNLPDTAKIQFVAKLDRGHALYSDMGRILLTLLEDDFEGHDLFGGVMHQDTLEARFGVKGYQEHRNAYHRSGKLALVTELAKHGLDERDLVPNVNFFARTVVSETGRLSLGAPSAPGARVVLQAEMDTLVVLAATQHRLDPRPGWTPRPIGVRLLATEIAPEANPAWNWNESNRRGFFNTRLYHC